MSTAESQVRVRPMVFSDLGAIISIDKEMRATGIQVAYKDFTTHKIFGIATEADPTKRPDILEVAKLVDLGFVAESEGTICGFIVGRQVYLAESDIQQGEIALIAIHPHYWGKGIATKLMNALCDSFRSRGMGRVGAGADPADKSMQAFLERLGFTSSHLLHYYKRL